MEEKLDEILPEVTRHAFSIQNCWDIRKNADDDMQTDYDFIIVQLLEIAKCLDYADEVGRRKMFVLLRKYLMLAYCIMVWKLNIFYRGNADGSAPT